MGYFQGMGCGNRVPFLGLIAATTQPASNGCVRCWDYQIQSREIRDCTEQTTLLLTLPALGLS